jgi:hypothetical protein
MAATFAFRASGAGSVHAEKVPGSFFDAIVEVTSGTTDYPTGGYAFGISQLNTLTGGAYSTIESVEVVNPWMATGGATTTQLFIAVYDKVNAKVQAFGMAAAAGVSTGLTECAAANANMNARTCSLRVRFY